MRVPETPVLSVPAFGQVTKLTSGLFKDLAKKVVGEADPAVRDVLAAERSRLADAMIGGLPYATAAGLTAVGTSQLLPSLPLVKTLGYGVSVGLLGFGVWKTLSALKVPPKPGPPPAKPTALAPLVDEASEALVKEAEPRIRKIVQEERTRLSQAAQAGLPWIAGGAAAFAASFFLIPAATNILKAAGYTVSIGLLTAGAWIALEKMKAKESTS